MIYPGGEIMKHAKMCAILAIAVFCASLCVVAIDIDQDDSAAYDPTVSYDFYLQLNDGTNTYTKWLPTATVVGAAPSQALFDAALKKACTAEGLTADVSAGWITSIEAKGVTYKSTGTWKQADYYQYGQFYLKADNTWGYISGSDYDTQTVFGITFDNYKFEEPKDKDKYYEDPSGYYVVKPDVEKVDYHIYLQLNDGEHTYSKWLPTVSGLNVSKAELSKAVNAACKEAGITIDYVDGWASSVTVDGIKYESKGTYKQPGYYQFAQFYAKSDSEWGTISTYNESSTVAIVFDEYLFSEPTEDKDSYFDTGYGYWLKLPSVKPNDYKDSGNNLVLYIVIGVVAVVAVAAIAFFLLKKKA